MDRPDHIRNPIEWGFDQIRLAALAVGSLGHSLRGLGTALGTYTAKWWSRARLIQRCTVASTELVPMREP